MSIKTKICKTVSGKFPPPPHPLNLNNEGILSYSQWQYKMGINTIKFYLDFSDVNEMFSGKTVLDIGCGAAGKTLYYASFGVKKIYGVEILEKYRTEAEAYAKELGLKDKFEFMCADATNIPLEDGVIDTIIMNDAMEHVDNPEAVLKECLRVLSRKGRLYLNFPPYYHPFGAHLSDAIGMPWVHLFFDEATLIAVYKDAVAKLPDGAERIDFRISQNSEGKEYFSYINKMTVKRFKNILREQNIRPIYYKEIPLRNALKPFTKLPILKEAAIKMVVCIINKQD